MASQREIDLFASSSPEPERKRPARGGGGGGGRRGGGGRGGGGGGGRGTKKKDGKGVALRSMQIFVKPQVGHRILIDVMPHDTVGDVKAKIEDFGDGLPILPPNMQRLYYLGRQLDDGSTLRHSNIHHGDTLELRWREGDATDYLFNAE